MASARVKKGSISAINANSAKTHAAASNLFSPKGISTKIPAGINKDANNEAENVLSQRRRLSVLSDKKLVDGMNNLKTTDQERALSGIHGVASYAGFSKKGHAPHNPRKKNQDSMILDYCAETDSLIFGVFDGHGESGHLVSQAMREKLLDHLYQHTKFQPVSDHDAHVLSLETALKDSLDCVERMILDDKNIETEFSGTTAILAVLRGSLLIVANVGDSRVIFGTTCSSNPQRTSVESISVDHKPDLPEERERIISRGGRVFAVEYDDGIDGPPRVWLGDADIPGLAMSRSIGDAVAHTAGVISEPEMHVHVLNVPHKCLVMATDGLWEFMTNEQVLDLVMAETDAKVAVNALMEESSKRWMKEEQLIDDTTIIVAYFDMKDRE